jgi:uncharacterized membrane protein YdfJ with MMPL/SSD domain
VGQATSQQEARKAATTKTLIGGACLGASASGRIAALQETGFGLAIAVFLDATIVRSVLVPSAMKLLGDRNWDGRASRKGSIVRARSARTGVD